MFKRHLEFELKKLQFVPLRFHKTFGRNICVVIFFFHKNTRHNAIFIFKIIFLNHNTTKSVRDILSHKWMWWGFINVTLAKIAFYFSNLDLMYSNIGITQRDLCIKMEICWWRSKGLERTLHLSGCCSDISSSVKNLIPELEKFFFTCFQSHIWPFCS